MKSVLISIQPKWCELISSGKKTIEVRKTAPKEVPFKAYIYMTKGKQMILENNKNVCLTWTQEVIGEFVCDWVEKLEEQVILGGLYYSKYKDVIDYELNERTCLDNFELLNYGKGKPLYGLHLTEVKIYDEPRELSEFSRYGYIKIEHKGTGYVFCDNTQCKYCESGEVIAGLYRPPVCRKGGCKITRPPQSWRYVEKVEE